MSPDVTSRGRVEDSHVSCPGVGLMSGVHVSCLGGGGGELGSGGMYSEEQCIMGSGHMEALLTDRQHYENITFPQLDWRAVIIF